MFFLAIYGMKFGEDEIHIPFSRRGVRALTSRSQAISYGLLLVLAFVAGWFVNGWRLDARMEQLTKVHATKEAKALEDALATYTRMEKTKDDAIKAAQERALKSKADASLAAIAADSLREQLASVPARIATASRSAVDQYATTSGELLVSCTSEYQWMARKADEHANSERTLIEAWPH